MQTQDFEESYLYRLMEFQPLRGTGDWLSWMKSFSENFYSCYPIKKPNNRGVRWIEAPSKELKAVQRGLIGVFDKVKRHPAAHGLDDKDYKKNAEAHQGSNQIFSLDLKDFYKSCTYGQIQKNIRCATLSKLINRYAKYIFYATESMEHYNDVFLATGSPLSPLIANLAVTDLDAELQSIADKWGAVYTRYLDDMNFSFHGPLEITEASKVTFVREVVEQVESRDWTVNIRKTKWINPQEDAVVVTGVDLRNKPKVTRRYIVNKMRPALNRLAIKLAVWDNPDKPFIHQGVESTLQLIQNLDAKTGGSLVYIKYVSEEQYQSLIDYFFKRFQKAVKKQGKDFKEEAAWWKNDLEDSFAPKFLEQIEDRQKELAKSDLPAILTWKVASAQVCQRKSKS